MLGTRRRPEAVAPLASRLNDVGEDPIVRASAAWALGRIANDDAMKALQRHLEDADPIVRESVGKAHLRGEARRRGAGRGESLESPAPHLPMQADATRTGPDR